MVPGNLPSQLEALSMGHTYFKANATCCGLLLVKACSGDQGQADGSISQALAKVRLCTAQGLWYKSSHGSSEAAWGLPNTPPQLCTIEALD